MSGKASGQLAAAAALAVLMLGCGSSSPTSPSSNGGGSSSGPGASGATFTISAAGVSPNSVTIAVGQSVTFVNSDSRAHQIASNPHPSHTDCPNINTGLGSIAAGQTKLTDAFMTARSCGFHDHNDPANAALQGTITIR